ncbi:MAG: rhomboid family intramembrane serine protease [Bryobacteraceae bacterium]
MIPLRVLLLRRTTPVITVVLIAMNLFTLLYENALTEYAQRTFVWRYALIPDQFHPSSLVTSMFLHGGWFHLIGNMWFLWVFGSHLEEALGAARYLAFYLISGAASAAVQLFVSLGSSIPTVGASGAIAGVMGAFLLLYPRARVITLIFFIFITTIELPAAFMLLYWFAIQLLSGLGSLTVRTQGQGIAWFAHVGGFVAGLLFVRLFADRRLRPRY